jgi:hypothetical protein
MVLGELELLLFELDCKQNGGLRFRRIRRYSSFQ